MNQHATHNHDQILRQHGLRKTAFRKEVLSIFMKYEGQAIASALIEDTLGEFDRITLYRTLKSFEDKGLVHVAVDGTGSTKYALCSHRCDEDQHHDAHAHFHCDHCGNTTCLEDMDHPYEQLVPSGYKVNEVQITISGICQTCI